MPRQVDTAVRHKRIKISAPTVAKIVHVLDRMRAYRCPRGELSVVFVGDREIKRLHADFLGDPTVTDVITFIGEEHPGEPFAGEICINLDQARRAAKEHGVTLATELRLYVAHGWLHLAGLHDETKAESAAMRQGEARALAHLEKFKARLRVAD